MWNERVGTEEIKNPKKSRINPEIQFTMKKYSKPQIIAKNLPSGSYAAGCPANHAMGQGGHTNDNCKYCERTA